jgi:hypothetical protein
VVEARRTRQLTEGRQPSLLSNRMAWANRYHAISPVEEDDAGADQLDNRSPRAREEAASPAPISSSRPTEGSQPLESSPERGRAEEKYPLPDSSRMLGARTSNRHSDIKVNSSSDHAGRSVADADAADFKLGPSVNDSQCHNCGKARHQCKCFRTLSLNVQNNPSLQLSTTSGSWGPYDMIGVSEAVPLSAGDADIVSDRGYKWLCKDHNARVGLFLAKPLADRIRAKFLDNRYAAVLIKLNSSQYALLGCVYLRTNLDRLRSDDADVVESKAIIRTLLELSKREGVVQVVLLGDCNETQTALDRMRDSVIASESEVVVPKVLPLLWDDGFTDVYRHVHPIDLAHPAHCMDDFTNEQPLAAPHIGLTRSRLDYAICKGFGEDAIIDCFVDRTLLDDQQLRQTTHRPLVATFRLQFGKVKDRLHFYPTLRVYRNNKTSRAQLVKRFDAELRRNHDRIESIALTNQAGVDDLTKLLVRLMNKAATEVFGVSRPRRDRPARFVESHRRARVARRAIRMVVSSDIDSPAWLEWLANSQFPCDWPWPSSATKESWLDNMKRRLGAERRSIHAEERKQRLHVEQKQRVNTRKFVQQSWRGEKDEQHVLAVQVGRRLVSEPSELKTLCRDHFKSQFTSALRPGELPDPAVPAGMNPDLAAATWNIVTQLKPGIDASWWTPLLGDIAETELKTEAALLRDDAAAGHDGVNSGLWKWTIAGSRHATRLITKLFSACYKLKLTPTSGKVSAIKTIWKLGKPGRTMPCLRPISLQSSLIKLLPKILTKRTGKILAAHPGQILHSSQHAFIPGGSTTRALATTLTFIRKDGSKMMKIDSEKAFDMVEHAVLARAMRRIHMPESFVEWAQSSLSGLTAYVKTAYGPTKPFAVTRSVRQGDPFAPIFFAIYQDALHDALHSPPALALRPAGDRDRQPRSVGFADDTMILATSLAEIKQQGLNASYTLALLGGKNNAAKNELLVHPYADESVEIDGQRIEATKPGSTMKCLGLLIEPGLDWRKQRIQLMGILRRFRTIAKRQHLDPIQASMLYDTFVAPILLYTLPFIPFPATPDERNFWKACDSVVMSAISANCAVDHTAGNFNHSAAQLILQLLLPSQLHITAAAAQTFSAVQQPGEAGDVAANELKDNQQPITKLFTTLELELVEVAEPHPSVLQTDPKERNAGVCQAELALRPREVINYPVAAGAAAGVRRPLSGVLLKEAARPGRSLLVDAAFLSLSRQPNAHQPRVAIISASAHHWAFSLYNPDSPPNPTISCDYSAAPQSRYLHLLQAADRAIAVIPANTPIVLVSADLGVLQAIASFPLDSHNDQVNAYGRPYLRFIVEAHRTRIANGGRLNLIWLAGLNDDEKEPMEEKAEHKAGVDVDVVDLADDVAARHDVDADVAPPRPAVTVIEPSVTFAELIDKLTVVPAPAPAADAAAVDIRWTPAMVGQLLDLQLRQQKSEAVAPAEWPSPATISRWSVRTCPEAGQLAIDLRARLRHLEQVSDSDKVDFNNTRERPTDLSAAVFSQGNWLHARKYVHPFIKAPTRILPSLVIGRGERRYGILHGNDPLVSSVRRFGRQLYLRRSEQEATKLTDRKSEEDKFFEVKQTDSSNTVAFIARQEDVDGLLELRQQLWKDYNLYGDSRLSFTFFALATRSLAINARRARFFKQAHEGCSTCGQRETLGHILLECPDYIDLRSVFVRELEQWQHAALGSVVAYDDDDAEPMLVSHARTLLLSVHLDSPVSVSSILRGRITNEDVDTLMERMATRFEPFQAGLSLFVAARLLRYSSRSFYDLAALLPSILQVFTVTVPACPHLRLRPRLVKRLMDECGLTAEFGFYPALAWPSAAHHAAFRFDPDCSRDENSTKRWQLISHLLTRDMGFGQSATFTSWLEQLTVPCFIHPTWDQFEQGILINSIGAAMKSFRCPAVLAVLTDTDNPHTAACLKRSPPDQTYSMHVRFCHQLFGVDVPPIDSAKFALWFPPLTAPAIGSAAARACYDAIRQQREHIFQALDRLLTNTPRRPAPHALEPEPDRLRSWFGESALAANLRSLSAQPTWTYNRELYNESLSSDDYHPAFRPPLLPDLCRLAVGSISREECYRLCKRMREDVADQGPSFVLGLRWKAFLFFHKCWQRRIELLRLTRTQRPAAKPRPPDARRG